jgi:hypothetical protein
LLEIVFRFFEELKDTVTGKGLLVFDVTNLEFCYSSCVKVFMGFSQDYNSRPPLQFIISNALWQVTSLKTMVRFSPNCTVLEANDCHHTETKTEEDFFFAPTGNGSIITKVICLKCGVILSESVERFNLRYQWYDVSGITGIIM